MDRQQWYRIVGEDGWVVAFVPFGDRTQADYVTCTKAARLIAAAPDLLAALKALLADSYPVGTGENGAVRERTIAAIAKAEGRS